MHKAKKRFGQNFLNDDQIINRIIASINIQKDDHILEIGPGLGALSESLFLKSNRFKVVEIDSDLIPKLKNKFELLAKEYKKDALHWELLHQDALTLKIADIYSDRKFRVVGNLPYNISTPLLFCFVEQLSYIKDMTFMLQKEVIDRICAEPNNKNYGRLSIMLQYYCDCENLFQVPPESFDPQPKVDSAIVRLTPHAELPNPCNNTDLLSKIVAQSFSQRRKTLRNNLKKSGFDEALEQSQIDTSLRPENIPVADYVKLCNIIHHLKTSN